MARRPKTPKFKEFDRFDNTFVFHKESKRRNYFDGDKPLTLELGCGKAEPSMALAKKHPDRNFIGIDIKADRLWRPAKEALSEGLGNIVFLKMHMRFIDLAFGENFIDEIWLTFSDPFPKSRQAKHRLTHPSFLAKYKRILKPQGIIHFKTDDEELFKWSLEQFVSDGELSLEKLTFDLHGDSSVSEEVKIKTFYEKRFIEEGKKIKYCRLVFSPNRPGRQQT